MNDALYLPDIVSEESISVCRGQYNSPSLTHSGYRNPIFLAFDYGLDERFAMRQLATEFWQIDGFPPHAINVYLAGDALIDCGTRWAYSRICRQLATRKPKLIALTHVHPDHQGSAHALCEFWNVPLACHPADQLVMEGRQPDPHRHSFNWFSRTFWSGPPHPVQQPLVEGELIAGFRVIHAPGHTAGSVILFRDHDRVAIVGDVINAMHLWTGWPGIYEPPPCFTIDPEENRRSILKLWDLQPNLICAGHGAPIRELTRLERLVTRIKQESAVLSPAVAPQFARESAQ